MASLPKVHGFCSFKGKIEESAWHKHRHTHKKRKLVTQTCTANCNRTWQSEIPRLVTGTLRESLSANKMLRSAYLACICLCARVIDTVMNDEVTCFAFERESSRWSESCLCACERTAAEAKAYWFRALYHNSHYVEIATALPRHILFGHAGLAWRRSSWEGKYLYDAIMEVNLQRTRSFASTYSSSFSLVTARRSHPNVGTLRQRKHSRSDQVWCRP